MIESIGGCTDCGPDKDAGVTHLSGTEHSPEAGKPDDDGAVGGCVDCGPGKDSVDISDEARNGD